MRLSEFVPGFLSLRLPTVFAHAYMPHDLHDLVSIIVSPRMTCVTLFPSFTCPSFSLHLPSRGATPGEYTFRRRASPTARCSLASGGVPSAGRVAAPLPPRAVSDIDSPSLSFEFIAIQSPPTGRASSSGPVCHSPGSRVGLACVQEPSIHSQTARAPYFGRVAALPFPACKIPGGG